MNTRELVGAIFEDAWNRQDFSTTEHALGRFRLHIRGVSRETDAAELRRIIAGWHEAFPDFRFDVHSIVVDGDEAAVRATLQGTNSGSWDGAPPTDARVSVPHMFFLRFGGGRLTDVWEMLDDKAFDPAR